MHPRHIRSNHNCFQTNIIPPHGFLVSLVRPLTGFFFENLERTKKKLVYDGFHAFGDARTGTWILIMMGLMTAVVLAGPSHHIVWISKFAEMGERLNGVHINFMSDDLEY
jgi:hypothetical protein